MYDFNSGRWIEFPDMAIGRSGHACGMAFKSDGSVEVVVAGGKVEASVEIFNFQTNSWRYGQGFYLS